MSRFLRYEACEKCRERGKDSRGDNLAVYSDGGAHCFSCGSHIHPPTSRRWEVPVDSELNNKIKRILPDDFTWDVPARCWEWLLQYGLPYDYWKGIVGWSEKYQRMVFRVGTPLKFSLGRYFGEESQSSTKRKWHVWGDSHQSIETYGKGESITLVEDVLSAHKVGQVDHTVCLFGTRVYPIYIEYLRKQNKPIILWLDEDQGDTMPKKSSNLELLTGLPVKYIITNKDPKEYNADQISHFISSCSS